MSIGWLFIFFKRFIDFFQFSISLFLHFFKGTFHFLCKGLYRLYKVSFKVIFFGIICVGILGSCCCRTTSSGATILFFMLMNTFLHFCPPVSSSNHCNRACGSGGRYSSKCLPAMVGVGGKDAAAWSLCFPFSCVFLNFLPPVLKFPLSSSFTSRTTFPWVAPVTEG